MAPEANLFNSFLRILENAISSGKNKQGNKKATRACLKVYRKTKIPRPATKEDQCCFFKIAFSALKNGCSVLK